jgi:hypothetical protein
MYSRRTFLIGLFLFTQIGLLTSIYNSIHNTTSGKFIKQGWVLQDGDI